jgi:hypothetical protein
MAHVLASSSVPESGEPHDGIPTLHALIASQRMPASGEIHCTLPLVQDGEPVQAMSHRVLALARIPRLHEPAPEQETVQTEASQTIPGSSRQAFGPAQSISQLGASHVTPR